MAHTLSPSATSPTWLSPDEFHAKALAGSLPDRVAIRQTFDAEIKAADDGASRQMAFVISTATPDRDKDVINPAGVSLANYLKNPVVLWSHDYSAPPIGRAVSITSDGQRLVAQAEFADAETYPFADTIYRLLQKGFLRATSIGFRPTKYMRNDERGGYDFEECELLEFSVVAVPANAEALAIAASGGLADVDLAPVEAWLTQVRGASVPPPPPPPAAEAAALHERLVQAIDALTAAAQRPVVPPPVDDDEPLFRLAFDHVPDPVVCHLLDDDEPPRYRINPADLREAVSASVRGSVDACVARAVTRVLAEAQGRVV